jgi:hypothetical protein
VSDSEEDERCDHQDAGAVPEPPEQPAGAVGTAERAVEGKERGSARRRHDRAAECAEPDEREHVPHAVECRAEADAAQQVSCDQRLEGFPGGDPERDGRAGPARHIGEERAQRHGRPEPRAAEQQGRDGNPGRGPDRRDHEARD